MTTRALYWDRGRPARSERAARTETFEVEALGEVLAPCGARSGRDARGPSAERDPQWSSDGTLIYFYKVSSLRDGEELWAISSDGVGERKIVDLRPTHPIGEFFDVSSTGQVVWVQYRVGRHELWLLDFPAS